MTNTIKTIIVDDEINSIHNLEEDLKAYPEIEILDTITSSQKAKKSIIQYQPDLLFLDVEMPYIMVLNYCRKYARMYVITCVSYFTAPLINICWMHCVLLLSTIY